MQRPLNEINPNWIRKRRRCKGHKKESMIKESYELTHYNLMWVRGGEVSRTSVAVIKGGLPSLLDALLCCRSSYSC